MNQPFTMSRRDFGVSLMGLVGTMLLDGCVKQEDVEPEGLTLPATNMYIATTDASFGALNVYAESGSRYVTFAAYNQGGLMSVKAENMNYAAAAPSYMTPYGNPTNTPYVPVTGDIMMSNASYTNGCFFTHTHQGTEQVYGRMRSNGRSFVGVHEFSTIQSPQVIVSETLAAMANMAGQLYAIDNTSFQGGQIIYQNNAKYWQRDNATLPCL